MKIIRSPKRAAAACLIATLATTTLAATATTATEDHVFYESATGSLYLDTVQFVNMLHQLRVTGQAPAGAATFNFSVPAADSPLFDPFLAARRTVFSALDPNGDCMTNIGDGVVANFVTTGMIASSLLDTEAMLSHLVAIDEAGPLADISVEILNNALVSTGLPLTPVTSHVTTAATPVTPDAAMAAWMTEIEWHATDFLAGLDPHDDLVARLTGTPRQAELLASEIWTFSGDTLQDEPNDIIHLKATFGIYGALPVLALWRGDHYVLLDAVTGTMAGPYHETTMYNPVELLLLHSVYQPGTGVDVLTEEDCTPTMGRWQPGLPPGGTPRAPAPNGNPPPMPHPPLPMWPVPLPLNPNNPGWESAQNCAAAGGNTCRCISALQYVTPGGIVWVLNTCTSTGPCGNGAPQTCSNYYWK